MKKIITALALIALIGAGCTKTPTTTPETTNPAAAPTITLETQNPNGTTTESTITATKDGQQVKNVERDADGVPIIDVPMFGAGSVRTIDLKIGNYFFEPKVITAKPGEQLRLDFRGVVGTHTLLIDAAKVKETVKDGSGFTFTVPTEPGSYPIYCDVGKHRANGMEGTLIVK